MEKNPWYKNVEGPFLQWKGPIGVKEDGGGCTRGQGRVGNMVIHRATFNKNKEGASSNHHSCNILVTATCLSHWPVCMFIRDALSVQLFKKRSRLARM